MQAWVVRGTGSPSEVFEWRDAPEPSHAAMRALTVDLAGLRTRVGDEPPAAAYVFVRVLAAALATPDVTMATGEYPVPIERPVRLRPGGRGHRRRGVAGARELDRQARDGLHAAAVRQLRAARGDVSARALRSARRALRRRRRGLRDPVAHRLSRRPSPRPGARGRDGARARRGGRRSVVRGAARGRGGLPRDRGRGRRGEGGVLPRARRADRDRPPARGLRRGGRCARSGPRRSTRSSTSCRASRASARGRCSRWRGGTCSRVTRRA